MRLDPARLETLRRLLIVDSSPERAYDDIAAQLASTFDVPITMISLLDSERDWFKARVGFPAQESPASTSFCESFFNTHDDLIVVDDTTTDARFASHPLVVGDPKVRFYAAARLTVDDETVGTLCAYGMQPKHLDREKLDELRSLANAAMELLRRRLPG